ncbi:hypothetical protein A9K55_006900 [Cordyceps militaris]|uniref:Uncharacterized protein n=1 Tax=Cordyceps militaris TaxID=73501 RepID=A0A2H4SBQ6_CORMI|nr:hypothetical protein A9K55_006900 [Cordyceps militaris]
MPGKIKKGNGKKGDKANPRPRCTSGSTASTRRAGATRTRARRARPTSGRRTTSCRNPTTSSSSAGEDPRGGRIRFIPAKHNGGAGNLCCLLGQGDG